MYNCNTSLYVVQSQPSLLDNTSSQPTPLLAGGDFAGASHRGPAKSLPVGGGVERPRPVTRGHLLQVGGSVSGEGEVSSVSLSTNGVVDWYAFTIPCPNKSKPSELVANVASWLPAATGPLERGMLGYTHGLILPGEGRILWNDDRADMGVHVELPSKCLRMVEVDAIQLCGWVHLQGGQCTRIDIALDTDQVTMDQVMQCHVAGDVVVRSSKWQRVESDGGGQTLYLGGAKSRRRVRVYNKAAEQGVEGVWTRFEVQFRRDQANTVSEFVGLESGLTDIINSCVDFRDSKEDSNLTRCSRWAWWDLVIGQAEKISFAAGSIVADVIGQAYTWIDKQVSPTLAFLHRALGAGAVEAMVKAAASRIPEYRLRVLVSMGAT